MRGNLLVPFLEGLEAAMPPGYSAGIQKRATERVPRWMPTLHLGNLEGGVCGEDDLL